jgi:hypothetical protein
MAMVNAMNFKHERQPYPHGIFPLMEFSTTYLRKPSLRVSFTADKAGSARIREVSRPLRTLIHPTVKILIYQ